MAHKWKEDEDVVACYVSRFGYREVASSVEALANALGIPLGAFHMRVSNFKALQGRGRLNHVAGQSQRVYEHHRDATEPDLRSIVLKALGGQPLT